MNVQTQNDADPNDEDETDDDADFARMRTANGVQTRFKSIVSVSVCGCRVRCGRLTVGH